MSTTDVFVNTVRLEIVDNVSIKRSFTNLICSASFSTPSDILSDAQNHASVYIRRDGVTVFSGIITSYSIGYQGKMLNMNIDCSDLSFILSHSLLPLTYTESQLMVYGVNSTPSMTGRLTFDPNCTIGNAIESMLTGTGIQHLLSGETTSYLGLRTTAIPESCLVFEPGVTRLDVIKKMCSAVGAIFFVKFIGPESVAVANTWAELEDHNEFLVTVIIQDSTHLVTSFNLESVPDMMVTRVTEEILNENEATNHAEAIELNKVLPYFDKYIKMDPTDSPLISQDSADKIEMYIKCHERAAIEFVGVPVELFNKIDLELLYIDMGISPEHAVWRITEIETTVSGGGVITRASLVSSHLELIDEVVAKASGNLPTDAYILDAAVSEIDRNKARIATITSSDAEDKTITIQYSGGAGAGSRESKTIRDWTL